MLALLFFPFITFLFFPLSLLNTIQYTVLILPLLIFIFFLPQILLHAAQKLPHTPQRILKRLHIAKTLVSLPCPITPRLQHLEPRKLRLEHRAPSMDDRILEIGPDVRPREAKFFEAREEDVRLGCCWNGKNGEIEYNFQAQDGEAAAVC